MKAFLLTTLLVGGYLLGLLPSVCFASLSESCDATGVIGKNAVIYRPLHVQIVHRHGDRTPITPLQDPDYWQSTLVKENMLEKVTHGTRVVRKDGTKTSRHSANGRGPFGKLTQLGFYQMIQVGTTLREQLVGTAAQGESLLRPDSAAPTSFYQSQLWNTQADLTPSDIRLFSTDFARTIQSVQGVLVGLFPDGTSPTIMDIDVQTTSSWMIPDPQPRLQEQTKLENELAKEPHVLQRHEEMEPLAIKCTQALLPVLGEGAFNMSFGVGEAKSQVEDDAARKLPWSQLAEITKCLQVRDRLPSAITVQDQEALSQFLAWKWFASLRNPRLAYLAMHTFADTIVQSMYNHDGREKNNRQETQQHPKLTIYSGHDSSLVGLLCAFRLEPPTVWPEYGSYLKIELLELTQEDHRRELVVRFSLNGELLKSKWHDEEEAKVEIALDDLAHLVQTEGANPNGRLQEANGRLQEAK